MVLTSSRTNYEWPTQDRFEKAAGIPIEDPNADIPLCVECALDHHKEMDHLHAEWLTAVLGC